MAEKESTTTHKAFKSCVECRRRKIRCSWTKEDTRTCRRCEERGVPCIPQVPSHNAAISRASSKARISQLETEVKQLRNAVFAIQKRIDSKPTDIGSVRRASFITETHEGMDFDDNQDDDGDDSDGASSRSSEIILHDRPSHMTPLFQNDWISTDARRNVEIQQMEQGRTTTQRLDAARNALQPLIPSEEQVAFLGSHVSTWLTLLQELSPTKSLADSKEGIIESYHVMKQPDVDPFRLACWLLALAITTQQLQPQAISPGGLEKKFRTTFPQAVQRAVENYIISHDSLCGTLAGLETCLLCLRLNLMKGILQKSWLALRRIISIAELIGLPRASRLLQQRPANGSSSVDPQTVAKAKLWESICSVERLSGTLMHFPIATRHYSMTTNEPLLSNGKVNTTTFWIKLGNIAVQLNDLDELASVPGTESELYTEVLRLDNELRLLASGTPREWWLPSQAENITATDIIKFQFHCISMRIHLPFVVKSDLQDRFAFSRMAGVDSCRNVTSTWCDLRRVLPSRIFFSRPFDAQAFTASVALLLNSYNSEATSGYTPNTTGMSRNDTDAWLNNVLDIMEQKSQDPVGYEYAQQASTALRSLISLLRGDGNEPNELTLKIPLLGTITVRRKPNKRTSYTNPAVSSSSSSQPGQSSAMPAMDPLTAYQTSGYPMGGFQVPTHPEMPNFSSHAVDNLFSWVINPNDELLFHDNLMVEDGPTMQPWQNVY